jgi:hypothetical protein
VVCERRFSKPVKDSPLGLLKAHRLVQTRKIV